MDDINYTKKRYSVTSSYSWKGPHEMLLPPIRAHEIPGGNFGVLRSVVFELGGFHPAMLAGEDFKFTGGRLVLFGKRVAYSPDCRTRHFINHQKLSVVGLRARFKGWGATQAGAFIFDATSEEIRFQRKANCGCCCV